MRENQSHTERDGVRWDAHLRSRKPLSLLRGTEGSNPSPPLKDELPNKINKVRCRETLLPTRSAAQDRLLPAPAALWRQAGRTRRIGSDDTDKVIPLANLVEGIQNRFLDAVRMRSRQLFRRPPPV